MAHQDELDIAAAPNPSSGSASNVSGPRCISGQLVRPEPPSDDAPSTACNSSSVSASGGVRLGTPPPSSSCSSDPAGNTAAYPRQWTPLNTRPKSSGGGPPDGSGDGRGGAGSNTSGGGVPPGGGPPMAIQAVAVSINLHHHLRVQHLRNPVPPTTPPVTPPGQRPLTCGHRWTGQGNLYQTLATFELQELAKFGHAADARSLALPLPPDEEMLKDIGSLKF